MYERVPDMDFQVWNLLKEARDGEEYASKATYGLGEAFAPLTFPDEVQAWLEP